MKFSNLIYILIVFAFVACEPELDEKEPLGTPPTNVSFSAAEEADNTFTFTNTTEGTFIHQWDLGNGMTAEGSVVMVQYPMAGTYTVVLTAFNDGGFATTSQDVVVAEDIAIDCGSDATFEMLTNCDQKVWKLDDAAGAFFVGPNPDESWWTSSETEITARPCAWDDEWIFTVEGEMIYDTKGQIWAEDYMGFNFECVEDSALPEALQPWASATNPFALVPGAPYQIALSGVGAFIGLPKATNGAEVTSPVNGNTYDIIEIYNAGDKDLMTLEINMGAGIWRFRLKSDL